MKITKFLTSILLSVILASTPVYAAYVPPNANGSATSANSSPVVVASDQAAIPFLNNIVKATSAGFARPATAPTYASGQLIANSATAGSVVVPSITVARGNDIGGFITQVQLKKTSSSLINAIFRIHFFSVLPTVTNGDTGTWSSPVAGYIGYFDVTMSQSFSDPAATGLAQANMGPGLAFTPVSGAQTLYYLIEARATYIGVASETFSLTAWVN